MIKFDQLQSELRRANLPPTRQRIALRSLGGDGQVGLGATSMLLPSMRSDSIGPSTLNLYVLGFRTSDWNYLHVDRVGAGILKETQMAIQLLLALVI